MRHKWNKDYTPPNASIATLFLSGPWRQCIHCGVVQERCQNQVWGRVVGYSWYPPAGLTCAKVEDPITVKNKKGNTSNS